MTINGITRSTVGLGNVDNTSDVLKPVSTSQQNALDLKANLASPQFSGIPTAPTADLGTDTLQIATTAFVKTAISNLIDNAPDTLNTLNELSLALGTDANFATTVTESIASKATKLDPVFTGTVTGVSAAMVGLGNVDNTTDLLKPVSTAQQTALDLKAPLDSPAFTGTVTGVSATMVGLGNVDNTTDLLKPVSTAQQTALDLKAPLASPAFTGTVTGVSAAMVGLGNVDNTTDLLKPVSTAQQTALDLKATKLDPAFTGTVTGVSAAMVGLGNVDNTSDALKPVSTAQQTALDLKAPLASPAFTGTVTGVSAAMVGLGNVDNTTDLLKPVSTAQQTALDLKAPLASPAFTGTVTGVSATMVGLGNVNDTSDTAKPVSTAQQTALDLKLNLSGGTVTGGFVSQQTTNIMEVISTATISSNAVTCNYASGGVYYLNGLTSSTNFALTLTNCNPANSLNVTNTITLLINCASFQAYANSINVNGEAKSMIYSGGATAISLTGATMVCQTISVVYSGNVLVPIYVISNVAPYFA
jgi:DNA-binding protein YbaB